ncbi:MFS transporter [Actinoplanes sp. ATCC 53533]|uniref:MFS transporter n=1 Tax=Actinoplanes sp. ATCC 53533 TaxID=1288362 RepID=UPI000F781832|nr:MFS transporter [Actinoplanes sp. ATCC 53533]RSM72300.1 MFS transporter [Actinoplanes sp. ATCC 53533]
MPSTRPPVAAATTVIAAQPRTGYRAVFAVREFRAMFIAHLLSTLGTVVCEIALSVLVYRRTGSPLLSALTFALGLLPYVIGGTFLSAVADRLPARRVLVVCDLLCAACAAGLVLPGTPVAGLLVLRCLVAAIAPVFTGTRTATLGDVLGEGDGFVLGSSVIRMTSQSAQLGGFAAGGLLLAAVSPRAVLGLTVGTFLASALLLGVGTRRRPARAARGGQTEGALLVASLSGLRQLLADRRVRALLLLAWIPPMFVVVSEALLTPYAGSLGTSSAGLGLLLCGMPIGAICSIALAGALLGPRGRSRLTLPVALFAMLPPLGYAWHPNLAVALICQVGSGCGIAYTLGLDQWFIAAVPERLRGRAMTLLTAGLMTAQGLGMTLAGVAAEFLPIHQVVAGGGVVGILCVSAVGYLVHRTEASPVDGPVSSTGVEPSTPGRQNRR